MRMCLGWCGRDWSKVLRVSNYGRARLGILEIEVLKLRKIHRTQLSR
jgi:hypothetical protein